MPMLVVSTLRTVPLRKQRATGTGTREARSGYRTQKPPPAPAKFSAGQTVSTNGCGSFCRTGDGAPRKGPIDRRGGASVPPAFILSPTAADYYKLVRFVDACVTENTAIVETIRHFIDAPP